MAGRRIFVAAVLWALAGLVAAANAGACSCAQVAPRDAMRQADAAIVGELIEVLPRNGGLADYRYEVRRVYKTVRRIGPVVSVRSSTQSAACGLPRRDGRSYGLFLSWSEGRWRGGLCGVIAPRQLRLAAQQMPRKGGTSVGPGVDCAS